GLASSSLDLLSAANDLNDSGTLAFYDPDTQRVSVRGTDMTPQMRVTLAHELTHALQDQYFDISDRRTKDFKTSGESAAFRALLDHDDAKSVIKPSVPNGAGDSIDDGDVGVTTWYLMLADRIDPLQALDAVDGWGGDAYVAFNSDGHTCMRMNFIGDTPTDN